jgi:hypothetical protein
MASWIIHMLHHMDNKGYYSYKHHSDSLSENTDIYHYAAHQHPQAASAAPQSLTETVATGHPLGPHSHVHDS